MLCATRPDKAGAEVEVEAALGCLAGSVAERAALCTAAKPTEKAALVEEVKAECEERLALAESFHAHATLGLWPFRDVPLQPPPLRRAEACHRAVQPVHIAAQKGPQQHWRQRVRCDRCPLVQFVT